MLVHATETQIGGRAKMTYPKHITNYQSNVPDCART